MNGKIYTGKTAKSPINRLSEHNKGSNTWSSHNGPFKLLYYEEYCCSDDADKRERFYKSGFGRKIRDIIISKLN